jgi:hypothetical protein
MSLPLPNITMNRNRARPFYTGFRTPPHGQPGWVAKLTPLSVDGMIVAASTTLLSESRADRRGAALPWSLLVARASRALAPTSQQPNQTWSAHHRGLAIVRLTASYEMLTRQVRGSVPDDDG